MQYKKPEYCAMIEDYINSFRNRQGSTPSVRHCFQVPVLYAGEWGAGL